MLGVAAQRIAWPIRKPRNNADECHCAETRRDGAFRAICFVAPLARGACHGRRVASRISSRKASVAATRGLFRGSLAVMKILGVGLSRTGTMSLTLALRQLGFRAMHYDRVRLNDVLDGSNTKPDFRRYDDVDAVTDIPSAYFYRELLEAYPESRAI